MYSYTASSGNVFFFFLMIRRPPRSTLFPTRRSSDLHELLPDAEDLAGPGHLGPPDGGQVGADVGPLHGLVQDVDRKSTRLNSSHGYISYAVFCLKKKKKHEDLH